MPSIDQTERFLSELLMYRASLKTREPLTEQQMALVRDKIYELVCDLDEVAAKPTRR